MKNSLNVVALRLVTGAAAAGVYHIPEEYFDEGQAARFDEVQGIWAGRCCEESEPDRPIAAAVEVFYSDRSQHGPRFAGQEHYTNIAIHHTDRQVEPDFYDSMVPDLQGTMSLLSWRNVSRCSMVSEEALCIHRSGFSREASLKKHGDY